MKDGLRRNLEKLYGDAALAQHDRYCILLNGFERAFGGQKPHAFFSAPGRSELGGNHTDHQHGCVLTAAVDLDSVAAVRREPGEAVTVLSEGYAPIVIDLRRLERDPKEAGNPVSLVRGIASRMADLGYRIGGFSATVTSNVLPGSGLSSSASFEVLICAIFNELYNDNAINATEIAKIARYSENEFFGKPCGLQDQMACALGGVTYIDFKDIDKPEYRNIPFRLEEQGYALCIVNTGGGHDDLTGEYAAILNEMQSVAKWFGREKLRFCDKNAFFHALPELRKACGDRTVLRAYHFFMENGRPERMAQALLTGDFKSFLALVNESGRSSGEYLQNIHVTGQSRDQALGIGLALSESMLSGCGAWRVHGGGFAGTIQAYVPYNLLEAYKDTMDPVFGKGNCLALKFRDTGPVGFPVE